MKRFQKYEAQYQLLQEAAFAIVRREGPDALTRRGLGAELGAADSMARRALGDHVVLPALAARECAARRRHGSHARDVLDLLLPRDDEVDREVVWLRLRLRHGAVAITEDDADLPRRYQLSTRGWADPDAGHHRDPEVGTVEREALAGYLEDREVETLALAARLVPERPELTRALAALVDGLTVAVCTGRLSPAAAREVLADHVDLLARP